MTDYINPEIVQALEQIMDGGKLSIDKVWSADPNDEQAYRIYLNSSMLEGAMELEVDDEGYLLFEWLEAMVAIAENNEYEPSPVAVNHIRAILEDSHNLESLMEEDERIEKVSVKLSFEVDDECFSGMNLQLSMTMHRRNPEGVLEEIVLMDVYGYDTL